MSHEAGHSLKRPRRSYDPDPGSVSHSNSRHDPFHDAGPSPDDQHRLIIALDLDAFYVSASRKRDPSLVGLPIGIQQKGLLATISYEARALGVKKLASIKDAVKQCPDMILVNGEDLSYFRLVSNQVWRLVRGIVWGGKVEKLGMDELFCDVTEMVDAHLAAVASRAGQRLPSSVRFDLRPPHPDRDLNEHASARFEYSPWPTLPQGHILPADAAEELLSCEPDRYQQRLFVSAQLASYLRQQVSDKIGLTCSAGVAHSKMLAKLVGAKHKPNQQTTFAPRSSGHRSGPTRLAQVQALLDPLELGAINGFGRVAVDKIRTALLDSLPMEARNVEARLTVGATRKAASLSLMVEQFGPKIGERLWSLACGIDNDSVVPAPEFPLQLSIEDTYPGIRGREIHDQLLLLSESLLRRLETELIRENRDASLEGIRHEAVTSSQEVEQSDSADAAATTSGGQVVLRDYRQFATEPNGRERAQGSGRSRSDATRAATWLRYPLKVRLSVRQGWNHRVTKQAPMPVQIFDLGLSRSDRAKILYKACRALLRHLIGGDDVTGDSMNLINIAALELSEKRPTKALESFFGGGSRDVPLPALPEDIQAEVMREHGLSEVPDHPERARLELGRPATLSLAHEPSLLPEAGQEDRRHCSPVEWPFDVSDVLVRGRESESTESLVCPHCQVDMPVWLQHDHETWPRTGLPPSPATSFGSKFDDDNDGNDDNGGGGRSVASGVGERSIASSDDEVGGVEEVCPTCEAVVPAWMALAHERFHQLDASRAGLDSP